MVVLWREVLVMGLVRFYFRRTMARLYMFYGCLCLGTWRCFGDGFVCFFICCFVFFLDNKGIKVLSFTLFVLFFEIFLDGWFDFVVEDVAPDDAVVGLVCLTVGGGMADGIFADG